jgi:hypothetical protein
MKTLFPTILICFLSISIQAKSTLFDIKDFYAGAGTLTQFVGRIQQDESGATNNFDFNPYLAIGTEFGLYKDFSFAPEFAFSFPKSSRDSQISKMSYWAQLFAIYTYSDFKLKFGPGLIMNRISADGGTQSLNNGTGTSDFPMPNGSSTSRNLTLNTALEWQFINTVSARFEGWVVNLSDSESRSFSYTLSAYYHFGDTLW